MTRSEEIKKCECGHTLSKSSKLAIYWCDYCNAEPINEIGPEKQKSYQKAYKSYYNKISKAKRKARKAKENKT